MRSVATPEDTAGSQVAFHVFTSSIPVTPWALVKRENLRHWSHPFGRVIPWGAATACAVTSFVIFVAVAWFAACRSSCACRSFAANSCAAFCCAAICWAASCCAESFCVATFAICFCVLIVASGGGGGMSRFALYLGVGAACGATKFTLYGGAGLFSA